MRSCALAIVAIVFSLPVYAEAQDVYHLVVPGTNVVSVARRSAAELEIQTQVGERVLYSRDPAFDSADGRFIAYRSTAARQVIRWPKSDRGNMEIAAWTPVSIAQFRASQMTIERVGGIRLPDPGKSMQARLAPGSVRAGQWLAPFDPTLFEFRRAADANDCVWTMLHVGGNVYRIQCRFNGEGLELVASRRRAKSSISLARVANGKGHLWTITPDRLAPGRYEIRSFADRNLRLGFQAGGGLNLHMTDLPNDGTLWRIEEMAAIGPASRVVQRAVRPGPVSPNTNAVFNNGHDKELWVLLVRDGDANRGERIKIPANGSVQVNLKRDPGMTIVETYEYVTRSGSQREDVITEVPSQTRFDVSVYELFAQSVSIDRTVPGGKVDRVGYAPRSLGWFELPPLADGDVVDVHQEAKLMKNPGGVRRLDMAAWQKPQKRDPIGDAIRGVRP